MKDTDGRHKTYYGYRIVEWAAMLGIKPNSVYRQLQRGFPHGRVFSMEMRKTKGRLRYADAFIRERRTHERQTTTSWAAGRKERQDAAADAARTLLAHSNGASRVELLVDGFSVIIEKRGGR